MILNNTTNIEKNASKYSKCSYFLLIYFLIQFLYQPFSRAVPLCTVVCSVLPAIAPHMSDSHSQQNVCIPHTSAKQACCLH